jgi:hypothetical protein
LDTPGASVIFAFPVKIRNVIWANFTTAGDTLLLQDANGKDIINAVVASTTQGMMSFGNMDWVRGIKLVTLTHGEITIAIGAGK